MTVGDWVLRWNRIELFLIGLLGAIALLLSLYVMATRYLFPAYSLDWGEEVIVYLLVWATWLSGSRLVMEQGHVQTDIVIGAVPPAIQHWLNFIHNLIGMLFSVVMAGAGVGVVWFALSVGERSESSIHFPLWLYYLALPFGLLLMAVRYCHQLAALWAGKEDEKQCP